MKLIPWLAACALASGAAGSIAQVPPAVSPPNASSQSPGGNTFADAVESAWQRAVVAREAHGQRQRADAERLAASSPWAAPPALGLSHRNDRWRSNAGNRETEIGLAWPLWLPGQRAARGAAAEAGIDVADLARESARLQLAGEVREAAWTLVALQAELAQADALLSSLQGLADDVERRVRAGDLARADFLAARAELLSAVAQQAGARQRSAAARGQWTLLTGLDAWPDASETAGPSGAAAADAIVSHPEMRLAVQATEYARRRIELVRASRRDPPELTLGVRHEAPGRGEPTQNSFVIGLRLPFGTDSRNQPLQAAALSELDVAQAREQRIRDRLSADASAARMALLAADQQLAAERDRAALLRERAQLIDKSFRAGESPLPDLLRALAASALADAALSRQQAAQGLARARLQQAFGLLP